MDLSPIQITIKKSERTINRLHGLVHSTCAERDKNKPQYEQWQKACADFRNQYESLVFSCEGYRGEEDFIRLLQRTEIDNDCAKYAREFAVCFIEIRPYYFRSGYLYKRLLRKLAHAPLTVEQQQRYEEIRKAYRDYRVSKHFSS